MGNKLSHLFFDPFRTQPHPIHLVGVAGWTDKPGRQIVSAIMADQFLPAAVQGQGNLAMTALYDMAAVLAHHKTGKTTTVNKQEALLALLHIFPQSAYQLV
jgi:hypothetical protein